MKYIIAALLLLSTALATDEKKPAPIMPDEVTLTSGRVLRNVQVVRWERDRVVLKYSGGVDPIAFSLIKSPAPAELALLRQAAIEATAKVNAPKQRKIGGQIFITTKGAGAYKFSGARVLVLPLSCQQILINAGDAEVSSSRATRSFLSSNPDYFDHLARAQGWLKAMEGITPIAKTTADSDGYYAVTFSSREPVLIYCVTTRLVGGETETNLWAVPAASDDRLDLNTENQI